MGVALRNSRVLVTAGALLDLNVAHVEDGAENAKNLSPERRAARELMGWGDAPLPSTGLADRTCCWFSSETPRRDKASFVLVKSAASSTLSITGSPPVKGPRVGG